MVRQHVNPLSRFFQQARPLPPADALFSQPELPLHLDIGCARGRFLLAMAQRARSLARPQAAARVADELQKLVGKRA